MSCRRSTTCAPPPITAVPWRPASCIGSSGTKEPGRHGSGIISRMPVVRPSPEDVHVFPTAAEFRTWLAQHHSAADALFVGFYKKGVAKPAMTYPQAVEEALCFGWIDGITYRIDEE